MVLRLIARSPRSTGLDSLRRLPACRPKADIATTDLIPASGDQDHTPSPSAADITRRTDATGVHRIPHSTFVTTRNAPLAEAGRHEQDHIFPKNGRGKFRGRGLTRFRKIRPTGKSLDLRDIARRSLGSARHPFSAYHRVVTPIADSTRMVRRRWCGRCVDPSMRLGVTIRARGARPRALYGVSIVRTVLACLERRLQHCGDNQSDQQRLGG
jgi:hypothetical protein